jgi:predicted amidohydrolase YtcJ
MANPPLTLYNAQINYGHTGSSQANYLEIRDGKIASLGNTSAYRHNNNLDSQFIDCQGGSLLPGFHDAHIHLLGMASRFLGVDCSPENASSIKALKEVIFRNCQCTPSEKWIRAWGYDESFFLENRHPNRFDLDDVVPNNPIRLNHRSGHAMVLNTLGLHKAGISRDTVEPPEGIIERDSNGEPTGLLFEMDSFLDGRIESLSESELKRGIQEVSQWLLSKGITTVQDASVMNDFKRWELLNQFKQENLLKQRLIFMVGASTAREIASGRYPVPKNSTSSRIGHAKIMITFTNGAMSPDQDSLNDLIAELNSKGFPVAIHAVEAEAVRAAAIAIKNTPKNTCVFAPNRIEHASELPPDLLKLVKESGVTVATNPGFLYFGGDRFRHTVPLGKHPWLYRIGSLLREGIPVVFGSDGPIELPEPIAQLYSAITRKSKGGFVFGINESISTKQALDIHTLQGAVSCGIDNWVGKIGIGQAADLTVLNRNILTVEPEQWNELKIASTILDGELLWQA